MNEFEAVRAMLESKYPKSGPFSEAPERTRYSYVPLNAAHGRTVFEMGIHL